MRKFLVLALALAAGVVGGRWLWIALHVGAGYAAKVACSLVLNSGQDAGEVVRDYVSREVAPLGALLRISVSEAGAEAGALGIVRVRAVHRPGLGCTLVPDGDTERLKPALGFNLPRHAPDAAVPWPAGAAGPPAPPPAAITAAIERAFREPD